MFAPEELLSLHGAARASLEGKCDILRRTRTRQPNGSFKDTTVTLASNIPCRKVPSGQLPSEVAVMQTQASRGVSTIKVDSLVEVTRTDVVVFPSGSDKEYGIAAVLVNTAGMYTWIIVYDDSMAVSA